MSDADLELLLEEAASAYRERDSLGRILPSPAWYDLPAEAREELFELQLAARALERHIDPRGLSATARAVLYRAELLPQLPPVGP